MIRHLAVRLGSLFKRERMERELDAELRYHVDMLVTQNIAGGMAPDEARREAMRVFGGYSYSKEYEIERYYRDALLMCIGEGTNEICRVVIAREMLKHYSTQF